MVDRIEREALRLRSPAFADEPVGRETLQVIQPPAKVAGCDEVGEVPFELGVALVHGCRRTSRTADIRRLIDRKAFAVESVSRKCPLFGQTARKDGTGRTAAFGPKAALPPAQKNKATSTL